MIKTSHVLAAMSDFELSAAALAQSCAALTSPPGTLHGSLYRAQVETIEAERVSRGLCPIRWDWQAEQELEHRFPSQPEAKPRQIQIELGDAPDEAVSRAAILLARAAVLATKSGEPDVGALLGCCAKGLDAHLPSRPGRGNAALN